MPLPTEVFIARGPDGTRLLPDWRRPPDIVPSFMPWNPVSFLKFYSQARHHKMALYPLHDLHLDGLHGRRRACNEGSGFIDSSIQVLSLTHSLTHSRVRAHMHWQRHIYCDIAFAQILNHELLRHTQSRAWVIGISFSKSLGVFAPSYWPGQ